MGPKASDCQDGPAAVTSFPGGIHDAWRAIAENAQWKTPQDVKKAHPKASILKGGRVVFNIKANDYRLIAVVRYESGVMMIRFFGSHEERAGSAS